MKVFIRTLVVWSTSVCFITGCSINRADSLRMLDQRADYDQSATPSLPPELREGGLEGFQNSPVPVRTRGQVAAVYAFPTEVSSTVYFWGAWFSLETEEPRWILTKPGTMPKVPAIAKSTQVAAKLKNHLRPKKTAEISTPATLNVPANIPASK